MKLLLTALNSKFAHKSLSVWCLKSFLQQQGKDCLIYEDSINSSFNTILENILLKDAEIIGFSCYIWNIELILKLCSAIKKIRPTTIIILGGPEVSFCDTIYENTDFVIDGQGEQALFSLLCNLEKGVCVSYRTKGEFSDFSTFPSPYTKDFFESETAHKLIYMETSRGCPYSCAYCLSSAQNGVFFRDIEFIKNEILSVLKIAPRTIKFVDRTFNVNRERAFSILSFVKGLDTSTTFHFEIGGDLFDQKTIDLISSMPAGRVQFEAGIQSTNKNTLQKSIRITNEDALFSNLLKIIQVGNCHVHVDLIAGLPDETRKSFINGFNKCMTLRPHMLQLGFLKLLKGSKLATNTHGAVFNNFPPYEVLLTPTMSFVELRELHRVEECVDKFYNTGTYKNSVNYGLTLFDSPFSFFDALSLFAQESGGVKVNFSDSYKLLFNFLCLHGDTDTATHFIKLDCLSFDFKGRLPKDFQYFRDRKRECEILRDQKELKIVRVEYFPFDNKTRLFIYDTPDVITRSAVIKEI